MQAGVLVWRPGVVEGPVLIRRPAIPRWWDPVSMPHVAVLVQDSVHGEYVRYYLSQCGTRDESGRVLLDVADIDDLPEGTLLEVRFSATTANLYRLERVDGASCWRWLERSRGLSSFEQPSNVSWEVLQSSEMSGTVESRHFWSHCAL